MITDCIPKNWKSLQDEVATILKECNFNVETEKVISSIRSNIEIDVFAKEEIEGREYSILCECKYWDTNIPQHVIHSFRTVLNDIGANIGYIISKKSFQKAAYDAVKSTNIKLCSYSDFLSEFETTWLKRYFTEEVTNKLGPLFSYAEPLLPEWFPKMSEDDQNEFIKLKEKYNIFSITLVHYTKVARMLDEEIPTLPLIERLKPDTNLDKYIPTEILNIATYREFLKLSLEYGQIAISKFRKYRDKYSDN